MSDPWYVAGFGEYYLELYAHRDRQEAGDTLQLLRDLGMEIRGRRILDLCCGGGRHLALLAACGAKAVGLDLSPQLLAVAREGDYSGGEVTLLRGDMRSLPLRSGSLDGVLSMFTSFGYFQEEGENWRVLEEVARTLKPGGFFLFDFLNRSSVARDLVPESTREGERWCAQERRWMAGGRVHKSVTIRERSTGETISSYEESVRLYSRDMIRRKLAELNLVEGACWGSYKGEPFTAESKRLLLLSRRTS